MKRGFVSIALFLNACSACDRPEEVAEAVFHGIKSNDKTTLEKKIHPEYSDKLGDRAVLLADLEHLAPLVVKIKETSILPGDPLHLIGTLEVDLQAEPSWRFLGPLDLEMSSDGGLKIRAGLLDDLRGIRRLFRARREAMEANDAQAYGALLHPHYRDGDLDRDGAIEKLSRDLAGIPIRLRPVSYWCEVRGLDAHVDERYVLSVAGQERAAIARFTLKKTAGEWRIAGGLYPAGQ